MVADFTDFSAYASDYQRPHKVRLAMGNLWAALVSHTSLLPITIEGSGAVTYYPRLKDPTVDKPRTTSLTRLVRYLSQSVPVLNEYDWQPLQDEIIKWASMELGNNYWTFEEVAGADLIEAYRTGPYSCMMGRNAQLRMYADNPDKVALLKVYQQGVYAGRALIWTADSSQRMLDRVYPGNGTLSYAARRHAKANGWIHKNYDGVGSDVEAPDFNVTLKHPSNRRIPYLDTMRFVTKCDDDCITLTHEYRRQNGGYYQTVGNFTGFSRVYDRMRYIDGGLVVRPYKKIVDIWRFMDAQVVSANFKGRTGRRVEMALRPTDTVYLLPNEHLYTTQDKVFKIGESYYTRKDIRKRRGVDEYLPKPNATAMFATDVITFSNGATAVILGVSA